MAYEANKAALNRLRIKKLKEDKELEPTNESDVEELKSKEEIEAENIKAHVERALDYSMPSWMKKRKKVQE